MSMRFKKERSIYWSKSYEWYRKHDMPYNINSFNDNKPEYCWDSDKAVSLNLPNTISTHRYNNIIVKLFIRRYKKNGIHMTDTVNMGVDVEGWFRRVYQEN